MLCWSWLHGVELPAIPQEDIKGRYFLPFECFFWRIFSRLSPPRTIILSTAAISLLLSANLSNRLFSCFEGMPYPTCKAQLYCLWYNTPFLFNALPLQRPMWLSWQQCPLSQQSSFCISSFLKPIAAQMFFNNSRVILLSYNLILHYIPYVYFFHTTPYCVCVFWLWMCTIKMFYFDTKGQLHSCRQVWPDYQRKGTYIWNLFCNL